MPGIFISYRRDDSAGFAGRLADALGDAFRPDLIFIDVTAIAPGIDFRKAIEQHVSACNALLVVIGTSWIGGSGAQARLQDTNDLVRLEVAAALRRNLTVIPVLVDGASMPAAEDLPADLEAFVWRNAVELRHARWDVDVQMLVDALRKLLPESAAAVRASDAATAVSGPASAGHAGNGRPSRWRFIWAAAGVAVLALALLRPWRAERVVGPEVEYPATISVAPPEVSVSTARYRWLSARVERVNAEQLALVFAVRMTNLKEAPDNLWSESFRLLVDGLPVSPRNALNEVVDGFSAKEGELSFPIEPRTTSAVLQVTHDGQSTRMPIDLKAAVPGLPKGPVRSRADGPLPRTLAIGGDVHADGVRYRILSARLARHNVDQLVLTVSVRMINERGAPANLHDASFRLLVDDVPRAPVGGLNELVEARSAGQGEVLFVFDDAERLVLLVGDGQDKTRVPLDLTR
jgi:hypothetical protein